MELFDDYGSADLHVFKEFLGHGLGHADTSVRGGVAWEVADMHADAAIEAHEVRHGSIFKNLSGLGAVLSGVGIAIDHFSGSGVADDAVEGGFMIRALLRDFEASGGSGVG